MAIAVLSVVTYFQAVIFGAPMEHKIQMVDCRPTGTYIGNIVSYINSLLKCYEIYQFENKKDILLSFCKQNATI
jgi:hypothetical protein